VTEEKTAGSKVRSDTTAVLTLPDTTAVVIALIEVDPSVTVALPSEDDKDTFKVPVLPPLALPSAPQPDSVSNIPKTVRIDKARTILTRLKDRQKVTTDRFPVKHIERA
jgi:hypothetical protein